MNAVKHTLVALGAALTLLAGGLVAAPPAAAVSGSEVQHVYTGAKYSSKTARIKVTRMNGSWVLLPVGRETTNARRICPATSAWTLRVQYKRTGTWHQLRRGHCFSPQLRGLWRVAQHRYPIYRA